MSNIKTGRNTNSDFFARRPRSNGDLNFTVYFTKESSIIIAAHTREASFESVIIHYHDKDVQKVTGVNINRLDTYNVVVKEFNLFHDEVPMWEKFATLQTSMSCKIRLPVQNGVVEEILESDHTIPAAVTHTAKNCKSTKVRVKYSCDQRARILDVGVS